MVKHPTKTITSSRSLLPIDIGVVLADIGVDGYVSIVAAALPVRSGWWCEVVNINAEPLTFMYPDESDITVLQGESVTVFIDASNGYQIRKIGSASGGDSFGKIAVSGQTTIDAAAADSTLTITAGSNISLLTDNSSKNLVISGAVAPNSWVGEWQVDITYAVGSMCIYNSVLYKCISEALNKVPSNGSSLAYWRDLTHQDGYVRAYSGTFYYQINGLCFYGGEVWKSIASNHWGHTPEEGIYWTKITSISSAPASESKAHIQSWNGFPDSPLGSEIVPYQEIHTSMLGTSLLCYSIEPFSVEEVTCTMRYYTFTSGAWVIDGTFEDYITCLLYTSPSPRDGLLSRMPSSA